MEKHKKQQQSDNNKINENVRTKAKAYTHGIRNIHKATPKMR